jgi:uncharacterized protein (DUF488 family)
MTLFTIGHSTRSFGDFLSLLRRYDIALVADARTVPRSQRHPHFSRDALEQALAAHGIAYRHVPALGGLRRPRRDSINRGWRHPSFRGYADHMASGAFREALEALVETGRGTTTAVMCAEAKWWQCHRQLIADALVARGAAVRHILSSDAAPLHALTPFARISGTDVTYPGIV